MRRSAGAVSRTVSRGKFPSLYCNGNGGSASRNDEHRGKTKSLLASDGEQAALFLSSPALRSSRWWASLSLFRILLSLLSSAV